MLLLRNVKHIGLPILRVKYSFTQWDWQHIPKLWNTKNTPHEKRILYGSKRDSPLPRYITDLNDTLRLPGAGDDKLKILYQQYIQNHDTALSSQNVALLIYNFAKANYLNSTSWPLLEVYIHRNRGQFGMRSIFGCLYGIIKIGKVDLIQFFVDEMKGQKLTFTDMQAVEIIQAFNASRYPYTQQFKFQFWDTYFKPFLNQYLIQPQGRVYNYKDAIRIFDAFDKFQYYHDQDIWNCIFGWLRYRKGWKRTDIIEKLYPLTGTFELAKQVFDQYYADLSVNPKIQWRYNLEELRLYTSEQMIAKSQIDIQMNPSDRTLARRKDQKRMNEEYHEWLKDGARQKEAELVKDKAQSLAYAIKNRYQSMRKDKADFSKLSMQEFQDLFGSYDKDMMYKEENQIMEEDEIAQRVEEEERKMMEDMKKNTKKY